MPVTSSALQAARLQKKGEKPKPDPLVVEAQLVQEDKSIYLALLVLQLAPALATQFKYASFLYFGILAVGTVYLGSKRQDIPEERTAITTKQALTAPVVSSISLFGVFLILKYTDVSVGIVYQFLTTFLGILSAVSVLPPLLRTVLPENLATLPVSGPLDALLAKPEEEDPEPLLDFPELTVLLSAVTAAFVYVNPEVGLSAKFLIPNIFAWCIAMQSIGLISISSFTTAAVLLSGLFCYDVFWVFGTEVMMTVATGIEAPVKFLFPSPADTTRVYPFSVLGLGDIVIPATFCTLMRSFDKHLEQARESQAAAVRALASERNGGRGSVLDWIGSFFQEANSGSDAAGDGAVNAISTSSQANIGVGDKDVDGRSYFTSSVTAYAVGLALCFVVNFLSKSGQPALLYLNPLLLASAFATAAANGNGELQQMIDFVVNRGGNEDVKGSQTETLKSGSSQV